VRELLTPALAALNPKAYIAHFKRLDGDAQRHYLGTLTAPELKTHFKTVGENATVGLFLTVLPALTKLEATVGGTTLGDAVGAELAPLQQRAIDLGTAIEAKVISGMVTGSLVQLPALEAALAAVGWAPKTVILSGDSGGSDCAPSLGWALRGSIRDVGTFYMPNEALHWEERAQVEVMLRGLAERVGAVLDVRLG
jgi:hypothetical protein